MLRQSIITFPLFKYLIPAHPIIPVNSFFVPFRVLSRLNLLLLRLALML